MSRQLSASVVGGDRRARKEGRPWTPFPGLRCVWGNNASPKRHTAIQPLQKLHSPAQDFIRTSTVSQSCLYLQYYAFSDY